MLLIYKKNVFKSIIIYDDIILYVYIYIYIYIYTVHSINEYTPSKT